MKRTQPLPVRASLSFEYARLLLGWLLALSVLGLLILWPPVGLGADVAAGVVSDWGGGA